MSIICHSSPIWGCPSYVFSDDFSPDLPAKARFGWKMFVLQGKPQKHWRIIDIQIDPLDQDGQFIFYDKNRPWAHEPLVVNDRISFYTEEFGEPFTTNTISLPCKTEFMYELINAHGKYAYLTWCDQGEQGSILTKQNNSIIHDQSAQAVKSRDYSYYYQPYNHLLYKKILLGSEQDSSSLIANNASQIIRADLKNFFSFWFDSEDIESEIVALRPGPLGLSAKLSFFLRILFFKIDLQLVMNVSFFNDTIHIPMVMHLPIDANKMLYPASGILFSWQSIQENVWWSIGQHMPSFDAEQIRQGGKTLAKMALPFCQSSECVFRMPAQTKQHWFSLDFVVPKSIAELGFFPLYVSSPEQVIKDLHWDKSPKPMLQNMGVYFETSGLPKGEHYWQFWIRLAKSNHILQGQCPAPVVRSKKIVF